MPSNPSTAQRELLALAMKRGTKDAEKFDPWAPWNVPLGVTANEAVLAGIPFAPSIPERRFPYMGALVLVGGKPCIYG